MAASGNQWDAFVLIKWKANAPLNCWNNFDLSNVKACWSLTGEWDLQIWLSVNNQDDLEDFVWNNVRQNEWVENTTTQWAKELTHNFDKVLL